MAYDTGLGATATIANLTAPLISISFDEQSRDSISVATLASTGFDPQIPADLASAGGVTVTVQYDPEIKTYPLPTDSTDEDVTITWPISDSSNNTKAYLKADGFVTGFTYPELALDTVQEATITIQFDGTSGNGPTWSAETKV